MGDCMRNHSMRIGYPHIKKIKMDPLYYTKKTPDGLKTLWNAKLNYLENTLIILE